MSPTPLTFSKPGLPVELIWIILEIAVWNHPQTAIILARFSRHFSEPILCFIYEVVSLHPRSGEDHRTRAELFRAAITTHPERAQWVKALLHCPTDDDNRLDILGGCSRVCKLHLMDDSLFGNFNPTYDHAADLEINLGNPLSTTSSLQTPLFQMVTHLIFQENIPDSTLISGILLLPRLTHVSITFSQPPENIYVDDQDLRANVQRLLTNSTLVLVHLYLRANLLQFYMDPYFVHTMHDLRSLSDPRLFVGVGRHWGSWLEWSCFYKDGENFWTEIVAECTTWRDDIDDPDWVQIQCSRPASISKIYWDVFDSI